MMMGGMMRTQFNNWDSMPDYMQQMMQSYYGGVKPFGAFIGLMELVTWVLVMALLVTLIRYFWNKAK